MGGLFGGGGGQTQPATYSYGGNPAAYIPGAQSQSDTLYQNLVNQIYNQGLSGIQSMGSGTPASNYWPQAQSIVSQLTNNPYAAWAQSAADQAATQGVAQGNQGIAVGNMLTGLVPQITQPIGQTQAYGAQVANTAFDPQQALYNQLRQQTADTAAAQNAQAGLSGSPYGVNLANQALSNFGINWQNQQLGRQMQGLSAYDQANQAAAGLAGAGANLAGLGTNLANAGVGQIAQYGALPYNTSIGQANTGLSGLQNLVNFGNNAWQLPQQTLNDLQSYLGLGQAASGLAGQLGQSGFNQNMASGYGTANLLGAGGNLLFGNQGLTGALGLNSSTGLLGGLGGWFGGASPSTFLIPGTDTGLAAGAGDILSGLLAF